jgi:hypothetical protein
MPKREPRPVTVSAPEKGRSKSKRRNSPRRAARRARFGSPCPRDKNDPGSGAGGGQTAENEAQKKPGRRSPRRNEAQVVQDGPPRMLGYARISTDDQTTALQADSPALGSMYKTCNCVFTSSAERDLAGLTLVEARATYASSDLVFGTAPD